MNDTYKEVYFDHYCKTCKYESVKEEENPCCECLENPVNLYLHKPVNGANKYEKFEHIFVSVLCVFRLPCAPWATYLAHLWATYPTHLWATYLTQYCRISGCPAHNSAAFSSRQ